MENGLKKIITLYLQLLHTIYLDQKIKIFNSKNKLKLIYIDDLIELFFE